MTINCDLVDNGKYAIKKVNYDIVLMDVHIPGISSLEATKIIKSFDNQLTIFAFTTVTLESKKEDFEKKLYTALVKTKTLA